MIKNRQIGGKANSVLFYRILLWLLGVVRGGQSVGIFC